MSTRNHRSSRRKADRKRRPSVPGLAPGTINVDPLAPASIVRVMAFDGSRLIEEEIQRISQLATMLGQWPTLWIDVVGLGSAETIRNLGDLLGLHPLALEDVVNVHQRAKVDSYGDYLFVVARMIDGPEVDLTEQISFFVKKNLIISFQERPGDCWDPVRQRLRQSGGRIRSLGADYLLYALLDAIIDSYFPPMDRISERVDLLDEAITQRTESTQIQAIHQLRGELLAIRRAIRPHREMINELIRDDHPMISRESQVFFRDCYDHTIQLIDLIDTHRELTSDLRDCYLSTVSNHMNEIMKVLTIMSTIFIPLSFVAGVYGMNFDTHASPFNMPELGFEFGYPIALGVMFAIALVMLFYFRMRKWI